MRQSNQVTAFVGFYFTKQLFKSSLSGNMNYISKICSGAHMYIYYFNPLTPRRTLLAPLTKILILFQEGIIKKISEERRAYESVDEKSLS